MFPELQAGSLSKSDDMYVFGSNSRATSGFQLLGSDDTARSSRNECDVHEYHNRDTQGCENCASIVLFSTVRFVETAALSDWVLKCIPARFYATFKSFPNQCH